MKVSHVLVREAQPFDAHCAPVPVLERRAKPQAETVPQPVALQRSAALYGRSMHAYEAALR